LTLPPFQVGTLVITPRGRIAEVISIDKEGRCELRYVGIDPEDCVRLRPGLLQLYKALPCEI
jgi:hypothetical protein